MANQRETSGRGHAEIPGSFQRNARGVDIQCGPGQYKFGNFFGAGCTDASKDRRSLGLGGIKGSQVLWDKVVASGRLSPYGKPVNRGSSSRRGTALPVMVGADGASRYTSPRRYRRGY